METGARDTFIRPIEIGIETAVVRTHREGEPMIEAIRQRFAQFEPQAVIDTVLENHSKHGRLRVDVPVGIAYKEDIGKARYVILEAMNEIAGILDDPAPDVVVEALGSSSVDLMVRVWIDSADRRRATRFSVVEASKLALDEAGIEITFPHLQLFLDTVEDRVWQSAERLTSGATGEV